MGGGRSFSAECTGVTWTSDDQISCNSPPGIGGDYDIEVEVCGQATNASVSTEQGRAHNATSLTATSPWPATFWYHPPTCMAIRVLPAAGSLGIPAEGLAHHEAPRRVLPSPGDEGAQAAWSALLARTQGPEGTNAALQTAAFLLDPAGDENLLIEGRYFGPSDVEAGQPLGLPEIVLVSESSAPMAGRGSHSIQFPCRAGTLQRLNDSFVHCISESLGAASGSAAPTDTSSYPVVVEAALGLSAGDLDGASASVPIAYAPWFTQFGLVATEAASSSLPLLGYPGTVLAP